MFNLCQLENAELMQSRAGINNQREAVADVMLMLDCP